MKLLLLLTLMFSCNKEGARYDLLFDSPYQITKSIDYNGVQVDLVIDKPEGNQLDVLMVFHGTVRRDSLILEAAQNALEGFKSV